MTKKIVPAFLYYCTSSATTFDNKYQFWSCSECGKGLAPENYDCGKYNCGYLIDRPTVRKV